MLFNLLILPIDKKRIDKKEMPGVLRRPLSFSEKAGKEINIVLNHHQGKAKGIKIRGNTPPFDSAKKLY